MNQSKTATTIFTVQVSSPDGLEEPNDQLSKLSLPLMFSNRQVYAYI
jgi:hypothetical protein